MNNKELFDDILGMMRTVKDDSNKLEMIHDFFMEEIYEEEEIEIPEKYKKLVSEFAEMLERGDICYLNTKTDEHIGIYHEFEDYDDGDDEGFQKEFKIVESWKNKIVIRPIQSYKSFSIMEGFADFISDKNMQNELINALNRKRPFAHFKNIVENSDFREDWFAYKNKWYEKYVFDYLINEDYIK